ncbi:uncharacterized protein LOC134354337 isoform X1 [Mobula hypostoma]|uniref:uncharacterized protein LOC134354337 isoform X1 n=1 Tax=Mobula hypostoma TaxID=723540 RepID=UPI002FC2CF82
MVRISLVMVLSLVNNGGMLTPLQGKVDIAVQFMSKAAVEAYDCKTRGLNYDDLSQTFLPSRFQQDLENSTADENKVYEKGLSLLRKEFIEEQKRDSGMVVLREIALTGEEVQRESMGYYLKGGASMRRWRPATVLASHVVVLKVYRAEILNMAHSMPLSGPRGVRKTVNRIMKEFYWPSLRKDVVNHNRTCHIRTVIKAYGVRNGKNWDEGVLFLLFLVGDSIQKALEGSLLEPVFSYRPKGPLTLLRELWSDLETCASVFKYVLKFWERFNRLCVLAKESLQNGRIKIRHLFARIAAGRIVIEQNGVVESDDGVEKHVYPLNLVSPRCQSSIVLKNITNKVHQLDPKPQKQVKKLIDILKWCTGAVHHVIKDSAQPMKQHLHRENFEESKMVEEEIRNKEGE